jgi:hypothetical protein
VAQSIYRVAQSIIQGGAEYIQDGAEYNTGWRRETGKFEVDYEIPPRDQVPSARGFVTLKRLVRNFEKKKA